jgi:vacuolar-type H+-ATPase subunit E/Vma4
VSREAILAAISAAGTTKVAQIEQETRQQVAAIRAEASAVAAEKQDQARREATSRMADELAMNAQQARLAAGNAYQQARADLIAEALAYCAEELALLRNQKGYEALYGRLLLEAHTLLQKEDGQIIIHADARDRTLLEKFLVQEEISAVAVTYDLSTNGGLIINNVGDFVVVDNTLETRFERARPVLQQEIARQLGLPDELTAQEVATT